jgi:HEAT repeat protein
VCTDARARQSLLSSLSNHPRARTRAAIADEAPRCGAPAVDALIYAMEHDRSGLVRTRAASALGKLGDSRARPALAKAARGEDADLAWTANNALKKIH